MALIEWQDSLRLGIAVVDRQHERIVGIVNPLSEAVALCRGSDVIGEIMDELII
jgi:hemerythrin